MVSTLALPLTLGPGGALAALTLDSPGDVAQSVGLLLATLPGERAALPDYGLPDPLGAGADPADVADVITTWEPRADPADIELLVDGAAQTVTVTPSGTPDDAGDVANEQEGSA